jgi:cysteine desulfurase family protein (TIGR01976 family)
MTRVATVDVIRADFPALRREHAGARVAYFDGPGGTQVPTAVIEAMGEYLAQHNANTHWAYPSSHETDAMIASARQACAEFLNGSADEVIFGPNMTTLAFHLARALGRRWQPGDEVIVTELDHHANIAPWQALATERGVVLRWLPLDPQTGTLSLDRLPSLLNGRTRLVAIGAASNALGTVNDVATVTRLAREAGVLTFVDGVHYAPHVLPDVAAFGCDFFACSAYKFYGPHLGILWGRRALLAELDPPRLAPAPQIPPESFETGTQNHEGIAGAAAAIGWLAGLSAGPGGLRARLAGTCHELHQRSGALFARLWEGAKSVRGVRVHGPAPDAPRTPTLGCTLEGREPEAAARALARAGCFASHGDFYAATVAERLGVAGPGLLRLGVACYTTSEEVDRALAALRMFMAA